MRYLRTVRIWLLAGLLAVSCQDVSLSDGNSFPHEGENIDRAGFPEPSGIVFHARRGTLFVVGDEGDLGEFSLDGTLIRQTWVRSADFEGITCNPATGLLYVAVEGDEQILEIDPADFSVLREFSISRAWDGAMLLAPGGDGIEAITFVPDSTCPEGGTFYLTNQNLDPHARDDPSIVFEVAVPLITHQASAAAPAQILRYFALGVGDLAGLHYDHSTNHLLVISDDQDRLLEVTQTGEIVQASSLPGKDQEGITLDNAGILYIAQDSGGILKIQRMPKASLAR